MKSILCTLLLSAVICHSSIAQQIPEKTLLWRIEGKNLTEPSYLYGTMHLYDQRIFNFGDSVYKALEFASGFANEIDPASLIDSMFSEIEIDNSKHLRNLVSDKKYKEISGKLKKKYQINESELTQKKIFSKRSAWYYSIRSKDDMDAVVDMYLYNAAKGMDKITGGVEDYTDQKDLFNEIGTIADIEDFANENAQSIRKKLDAFIDLYLTQDIEAMYHLSIKGETEEQSDKILDNRNFKMARNIDSLSHLRSTFYAVGAAHLAGKNGLINLLREHGFTINPVYSSKKIHAKNYSFKTVPVKWEHIYADDSSYLVKMPGKSSDLKLTETMPAFKMYFDIGSNLFYMVTAFPSTINSSNTDSLLDAAIKRFWEGSDSKTSSAKKLMLNNYPAMQAFSKKDDIYFKMNMVLGKNQMYLLMAGAQKKEALLHQNIDSFFSSLTINEKVNLKPNEWHRLSNKEIAAEIEFPSKPSEKKGGLDEEAEKTWDAVTISSIDFTTGGYFTVLSLSAVEDLYITEDSTLLNYKKKAFDELGYKTFYEENLNIQGFPAYRFKGKAKAEGIDLYYDVLTVNRINRNYTVMAFIQENPKNISDAERFINSFKFTDFEEAKWSTEYNTDSSIKTWSPSAIIRNTDDDENGKTINSTELKAYDEYMIDHNSSMKYTIVSSGFSEYFSRPNEDSLLRELIADYYSDTTAGINSGYFYEKDSLIYLKKVKNGTANGIEIITQKKSIHNAKRFRLLLNGDSCYKIFTMGPLAYLQNNNTNKFFEELRFTKPAKKTSLYNRKSKELFSALLSKDSTTRAQAKDYLMDANFTKEELPLLYKAYMEQYAQSDESFLPVERMLANKINEINDSIATPAFADENYTKASAMPAGKASFLLYILSNHQTASSYALLKKHWISNPPQDAHQYYWSYAITDSLQLAASLFPELQQLYNDTANGSIAIRIAATLLDSNLVAKEKLIENTQGIYHHSKWLLNKYADKEYYNEHIYSLFRLLEAAGSAESIGLLHQFSQLQVPEIRYEAVATLFQMKQIPDNKTIDQLAATAGYRISLFNLLKKHGFEKMFPKKYLNQESFAESHLYDFAIENDLYFTKIEKLQEHEIAKGNLKGTYYSFKISDDNNEHYLGFAGPFSKDTLITTTENVHMEIYYDKPFGKSAVKAAFEEFIRELDDK